MAEKKRVDFRKNRNKPPRDNNWTQGFQSHGYEEEATVGNERVRAKGELSRKRTIETDTVGDGPIMPMIDRDNWIPGRVLRNHGLNAIVATDDGRSFRCMVRRLLKTMTTDERAVVTTGDRVWIRPSLNGEGFIERVEPRHGLLTRASRGREHVLVSNVDQVVIVMSLVEPEVKPHLIDRYLASAEQGGLKPILCLNKADLADPAEVQPLLGFYSQLGVPTILTSATTGIGIPRLNKLLKDRQSVFSGQSGVGKSSLLNAVQPGLDLSVRTVSENNQKGRHTTTTCNFSSSISAAGWSILQVSASSSCGTSFPRRSKASSRSFGLSCRYAAFPIARTRMKTAAPSRKPWANGSSASSVTGAIWACFKATTANRVMMSDRLPT